MASQTSFFILASLLWVIYKAYRYGRREHGLPPGPPTIPVLGNLHVLPKDNMAQKFTEWAQRWGDIFSIKIASNTMIVLSSATAVKEVVDKTGWSASSRPPSFLIDKVTDGHHIVFTPYGPKLKKLRKACLAPLSPQAVFKHIPIAEAETGQLLYDLLIKPEAFYDSVRRFAHSVTKSVVYGKRVPYFDTPEVVEYYSSLDDIEHTCTPGVHPPIDLIPILKYVPERWAPWLQECEEGKRRRNALHFPWFIECEENFKKGREPNSLIEEVLQGNKELDLSRDAIANLGIILTDGGSDSSATFVNSLILTLTAHPEVQRRAQEEIDSVLGGDRVPSLDDLPNLPYIDALMKEVIRFRPIFPLLIPHYTTEDLHYSGYAIPKESMLFINIWGIFHDPSTFDQPEVFNPDRYLLSPHGTIPGHDDGFRDSMAFGSGRRVCPGMHIARHTMALATMGLIWAFEFSPAVDPASKTIVEPDLTKYRMGILAVPKPFECTIKPRGSCRADIVRRTFAESTNLFARYEERLSVREKEMLRKVRDDF